MSQSIKVGVTIPDGSTHVLTIPLVSSPYNTDASDAMSDLVDLLRDSACERAKMVVHAIDMRAGNPATLIFALIQELNAGVVAAQMEADALRAELAEWKPKPEDDSEVTEG